MLKKIVALGGFVLLAVLSLNLPNNSVTPAYAIFNGGTLPTQSLGYQQFTSLGSAINLSTSTPAVGSTGIPAGAWYAVITIEGAGIRWRDDGTSATASVGMPQSLGQTFVYTGSFSKMTIIQQSASATINVSYYR